MNVVFVRTKKNEEEFIMDLLSIHYGSTVCQFVRQSPPDCLHPISKNFFIKINTWFPFEKHYKKEG